MKKQISFFGLLIALIFNIEASFAGQFDHRHQTWATVLKEFVQVRGSESRVDYNRLKAKPKTLADYLASLESISEHDFEKFNRQEKLAFLINAYNAFTVKLIVDHYPVKSIKDIGGMFSSPWKMKFFRLVGRERTLDELEHELIRPKFDEPRIHFALVCASLGCPPLRGEPFVADQLEKQLENSTVNFLKDSSKNRLDTVKGKLELSSIFKWYGSDFTKVFGSVEAFIATRLTDIAKEQEAIRTKKFDFSYLDYDWNLNDSKTICTDKVCKR